MLGCRGESGFMPGLALDRWEIEREDSGISDNFPSDMSERNSTAPATAGSDCSTVTRLPSPASSQGSQRTR